MMYCTVITTVSAYDTNPKEDAGKFCMVFKDGCLMLVFLLSMSTRSADYAGKMAFSWNSFGTEETWCAEIALERRSEHGMWGKIEWFGIALLKSTWILNWIIFQTLT